jgi:hypothetical protein
VLQQGLPVLPRDGTAPPIEARPTSSSSGRFVEPGKQ